MKRLSLGIQARPVLHYGNRSFAITSPSKLNNASRKDSTLIQNGSTRLPDMESAAIRNPTHESSRSQTSRLSAGDKEKRPGKIPGLRLSLNQLAMLPAAMVRACFRAAARSPFSFANLRRASEQRVRVQFPVSHLAASLTGRHHFR